MIRNILLACAILLTLSSLVRADTYGNVQVNEVRRVVDGDTFRCDINGWPDVIGKDVPIRIAGIDTPELKADSQTERRLAENARRMTLDTLKGAGHIELRNVRRGKYFRIVGEVWVDGISLGEKLVSAGLAEQKQ